MKDEWTSCGGRYLSDDQRAVLAGRGARVALAFVVNNHGLHRLGLAVAQPGGPAGEQEGGSRSPQTAVPLARLTRPIRSGRCGAERDALTRPWSPRGRRWTPRPLPDRPLRRRLRRWCPIPRWRRSNPSPCWGGGRRPRRAAPWPEPSGPGDQGGEKRLNQLRNFTHSAVGSYDFRKSKRLKEEKRSG